MNKKVRDLILRPLETIKSTFSVRDTAKIMKDKDISSLLVTDDEDRPVGIVTERDIVRKVVASDQVEMNEIISRDIVSFPLITVSGESPAGVVAELFIENNIRHLLVTENVEGYDKPLGILTPLDFIWYREEFGKKRSEDRDEEIETMLEFYRYLH